MTYERSTNCRSRLIKNGNDSIFEWVIQTCHELDLGRSHALDIWMCLFHELQEPPYQKWLALVKSAAAPVLKESFHLNIGATYCNTLQHTATQCNTIQYTATHGRCCAFAPHNAIHYNTLQLIMQDTIIHCNNAIHYNSLQQCKTL